MEKKVNISGRAQAEISIILTHHLEKTEEAPAMERIYKFSMPTGAPLAEAIHFAKEILAQVEEMKKKAEEQEAKKDAPEEKESLKKD